jgi:hypothetical protein
MQQISLPVQTLYAELIEQCRADTGLSGSLYERDMKGGSYTYLKMQVGSKRLDIYLGKSGDAETASICLSIERSNTAMRNRRQLVQMLKKHLPAPLAAMADVADVMVWSGLMREAVLVGTNAYLCYPALVGYRLDAAVMGTEDIDVATLNLALAADKESYDFGQLLQIADPSFKALPEYFKRALPSRFASERGYRVDLLTQQRSSRSEAPLPLPKLNAGATPLQHLAWLVENPASAVLLSGGGLLMQVPQPARYAVHKLIVAQKRNSSERLKRRKDLAQAESLIFALQKSDPTGLSDAYSSACAQGKKGWAVPLTLSLRELGIEFEVN